MGEFSAEFHQLGKVAWKIQALCQIYWEITEPSYFSDLSRAKKGSDNRETGLIINSVRPGITQTCPTAGGDAKTQGVIFSCLKFDVFIYKALIIKQ